MEVVITLLGGAIAAALSGVLPMLLDRPGGWSLKVSGWFRSIPLGYLRTASGAVFGLAAPTAISLSTSNEHHRTITYIAWWGAALAGLSAAIVLQVVIDRRAGSEQTLGRLREEIGEVRHRLIQWENHRAIRRGSIWPLGKPYERLPREQWVSAGKGASLGESDREKVERAYELAERFDSEMVAGETTIASEAEPDLDGLRTAFEEAAFVVGLPASPIRGDRPPVRPRPALPSDEINVLADFYKEGSDSRAACRPRTGLTRFELTAFQLGWHVEDQRQREDKAHQWDEKVSAYLWGSPTLKGFAPGWTAAGSEPKRAVHRDQSMSTPGRLASWYDGKLAYLHSVIERIND